MNMVRMAFQGYRSLRDVELALGPFTVLVGPNNAGKSNIVDAIAFYKDILIELNSAINDRGGFQHLVFRGVNGPVERIVVSVEAEVRIEDVQSRISNNGFHQPPAVGDHHLTGFRITHSITLAPDPASQFLGFLVAEEALQIHAEVEGNDPRLVMVISRRHDDLSVSSPLLTPGNEIAWLDLLLERPFQTVEAIRTLTLWNLPSPSSLIPLVKLISPIVDVFATSVSSSRVYRFDPAAGRGAGMPSSTGDITPRGNQLPVLAAYLQAQQPEVWERILQWVRLVAPGVEHVAVRTDYDRRLRLEFSEFGNLIPWSDREVSDGTLRSLMLFAALFDPRWGMQVFEEPENSLHPWAIRAFVDACREVLAESAEHQVAMTTHSQALIDYVSPAETTIVWRQDGATQVRPLVKLDPSAWDYWAEGHGRLSSLLDSGLLLETVPVSPE